MHGEEEMVIVEETMPVVLHCNNNVTFQEVVQQYRTQPCGSNYA